MHLIIYLADENGCKYEVEDARLVAEYNKTVDEDEDDSYCEELYQKNSGTYLLYCRTTWNEFKGEGIRLLNADQARDWIRQHSHNKKHQYADLWGEAAE